MPSDLKPLEMRNCRACGKRFVILPPWSSRSLTCSEKCSKILRKKRNYSYYKEHYLKRPTRAVRDTEGRFVAWRKEPQ